MIDQNHFLLLLNALFNCNLMYTFITWLLILNMSLLSVLKKTSLEIEQTFRICKLLPTFKSYQMDKSEFSTYDITFREQSLGILFISGPDHKGAIVDGFYRLDNQMLEAERSMQIALNDFVVSIQGKSVINSSLESIEELLVSKKRPIKVRFGIPKNLSSVSTWENIVRNDLYIRAYLSFLKKKSAYICTVWMQFLLAVNKYLEMSYPDNEEYFNQIRNEYLLPEGKYYEVIQLLTECDSKLKDEKVINNSTLYIHAMKATIKSKIKQLTWNAFTLSPE